MIIAKTAASLLALLALATGFTIAGSSSYSLKDCGLKKGAQGLITRSPGEPPNQAQQWQMAHIRYGSGVFPGPQLVRPVAAPFTILREPK